MGLSDVGQLSDSVNTAMIDSQAGLYSSILESIFNTADGVVI